jgi:hypothetical protein
MDTLNPLRPGQTRRPADPQSAPVRFGAIGRGAMPEAAADRPDGGAEVAGRLVAEMGATGDQAQALAYRLFEIATQKGWASEALIYNALAHERPHLEDAAARVARVEAPAQAALNCNASSVGSGLSSARSPR